MPSDIRSADAQFAALRRYLDRKTAQGHTCHAVRQADAEEMLPSETPQFQRDVHPIESDRLEVRDTGYQPHRHSGISAFEFFLDGVQYSHLVGFLDNIPLVHHLSAAAILRRDPITRQLSLWRTIRRRECFLVPFAHLDPAELYSLGVDVADTTDESPDAPLETTALRALAHSKSQRIRRGQESDLIEEWARSGEEGWLMVDGPLMLLPRMSSRARMVGVIKSFGAQFFYGEEQLRIMTLPQGKRTTAFQLPRGSAPVRGTASDGPRRWYSWYVRVRDNHQRDADFGLLRVETPPDPALLAAADEISRWLIAERAPLSTPDPRWGNLLYPIHAVERYLKSTLPERNRVHLHLL